MRGARTPQRVMSAAIGLIAPLAAAGPVMAVVLWTMTVSPTTAVEGDSTAFTFTATNGDAISLVGCVVVHLPRSFAYHGAGVIGTSSGVEWHVERSGSTVAVHAAANGGRLRTLESVEFEVVLTAEQTGTHAFAADAYSTIDCTGTASALALAPTVLVTARPTSTPTPRPTPRPTPVPTPTPRPTPTPTPTPSSTGAGNASPAASESGGADPMRTSPAGAMAPDASSGSVAASGRPRRSSGSLSALGIDPLSGEPTADAPLSLDLGPFSPLGGAPEWSIPAVVVGTPGVLLILWVVLQVSAAVAWLPLVRRLRGSALPDESEAADVAGDAAGMGDTASVP